MDTTHRGALEREVERLIVGFFYHLDERRYDELSELISVDGVWHRQGEALRGPAMVRAALLMRLAGTVTRHVVSNLLVDLSDETNPAASFYMTVFRHDAEKPAEGPVAMELPYAVASCRAALARTARGWRFMELAARPAFRR